MAKRPTAKAKAKAEGRTEAPRLPDLTEARTRAATGKLRASGLNQNVNEVLQVAADALRGVHRQHKKFSRKTKLSDRAIYVLGLISGGLNRPSLLIDYFDVLPSTITVETDKLVEAGLIVREIDPSDRRVIRLALTASGQALLRQAMDLINSMFLPRVQDIPEEELRACIDTLRKIVYPVDPTPAESQGSTRPLK